MRNYENEIAAISEKYGSIVNRVLTIDLALLKLLCPRSCPQARSYIGLTNYCFRVYGATIIITSQRNPTGGKT